MYKKKIKISYKPGIHARPATIIAQNASNYNSDIIIESEAGQANLKSLLGLLSLGIASGEEIMLRGEGKDEKEAVKKIAKLINSGLEEEVEKKFSNRNNSQKEIIKKINKETTSKNKYNVESEKLLKLIGTEVKNKIKHIKELINIK